jgi:hypothetical protein
MNRVFFAFLLITALHPLRADDWLDNSNFTDAGEHWYGEAQWPADFAPPDPFTKADPFTASGMIIPLKSAQWMKALQDFKGKGTNAVLRISYVLSPGLTFSQKPEDYQNMPDKIGWDAWEAFNTPPNTWVVFISEIAQRHGNYFLIQPKLGDTAEQTYVARVEGMTPWTQKTIALAFPPGNGTIVIHKVEIVDQDAATQ